MRLALGLLLGAMAFGQGYRHLATTDDGSRLYFSADLPAPGIYVFDGVATRLFTRDDNNPLVWPSVSGDGRIVGFSAVADGRMQARVALSTGAVVWNYAGQAAVSRNGRFALFMADGAEGRGTVVDLGGGPAYSMPLPLASGAHSIASDGTFVTGGPNAIRVVRPSGIDTYDAPDTPTEAVIDARATAVAYVAGGNLMRLDLESGVSTAVASGASGPRFTADGQGLLYLAPDANGIQQAWMGRQLTFEDTGIVEATISGDGRVAFAVTGSMRAVRIDVASGAVQALNLAASNVPAGVPRAAPDETPVQIVSFKNDPSFSPVSGGPMTLSWTTQNAERVNMVGLGAPGGALAVNGSAVVRPDTNTTYTLFAYGPSGQVVSSVLYVFVR